MMSLSLTITDRLIRSADTPHTARLIPGSDPAKWRVTWLPGRALTQDQAIAAMTLADLLGSLAAFDCDPEVYDDKFWEGADALAAALGMSGPVAVAWASESPEDAADDG